VGKPVLIPVLLSVKLKMAIIHYSPGRIPINKILKLIWYFFYRFICLLSMSFDFKLQSERENKDILREYFINKEGMVI
jgi:hypothetical protein